MTTPPEPTIRQRIIDANHLAKEGMPAEALALILQCMDELTRAGAAANGVSPQVVFVALVSLARSYPPARQAMIERKEQIRLLTQSTTEGSIEYPPKADPEAIDASRRYQRAAQMVMRGEKPEETLQELLWCFDEGMKSVPALRGVRLSFLIGSIAKLGETYPPARAALQERQNRIRRDWRNDPEEWQELAAICRVLNDNASVLAFYDDLKRAGAGLPDPRWIFDQLIEAQRYNDAVAAYPVVLYRKSFDQFLAHMARRPENPFALMVRHLAALSGNQIEALAGSGDVSTAASVVIRMLEIDRSDETLKLLKRHAERCGHPELIPADT